MNFTVDELYLMSIYETELEDKYRLLAALRESLLDVDEPEMIEVMESAISKLEAITEDEYAYVDFFQFLPFTEDDQTDEWSDDHWQQV